MNTDIITLPEELIHLSSEVDEFIEKAEIKRKCIRYSIYLLMTVIVGGYLYSVFTSTQKIAISFFFIFILLFLLVLYAVQHMLIQNIAWKLRDLFVPTILSSLHSEMNYQKWDTYQIETEKIWLLAENDIVSPFNTLDIKYSGLINIRNLADIHWNILNLSRNHKGTGKLYGKSIVNNNTIGSSCVIEICGKKPRYTLQKPIIITTDWKESSYSKKTHHIGSLGFVIASNVFTISMIYVIITKLQSADSNSPQVGLEILKSLWGGAIIALILWFIGYKIWVHVQKYIIKKKTVSLENTEFEKQFDVIAGDPVESRMIVTPAFMERLYGLSQKTWKKYSILFTHDTILIHWEIWEFLIVSDISKDLTKKEFISDWYKELSEPFQIIADMNIGYYFLENTAS
jgi:Protein of unknown function (DUF3137)